MKTKFKRRKMMKTQIMTLVLALVSVATFAINNEEVKSTNNFLAESEMVESAEMEFDIALEDWMLDIDNNTWGIEVEHEIEIEKWMTQIDDNSWDISIEEEPLKIESWMLSSDNWLKK